MKKYVFTFFGILLSALTFAQTNTPALKTYCNQRFEFCAKYPANFTSGKEPENGDGLTFTSPDKKARLTISGSYADQKETIQDYFNNYIGIDTIGDQNRTLEIVKNNWAAVSYTSGNKIIYTKTALANGIFKTLYFEYPKLDKAKYDKLLTQISQSFN